MGFPGVERGSSLVVDETVSTTDCLSPLSDCPTRIETPRPGLLGNSPCPSVDTTSSELILDSLDSWNSWNEQMRSAKPYRPSPFAGRSRTAELERLLQATQPSKIKHAKQELTPIHADKKSRAAVAANLANLASTHARPRRPALAEQAAPVFRSFDFDDDARDMSPNTTKLLSSSQNSPITESKPSCLSQLDECKGFTQAARLGRTVRRPSTELDLEAEAEADREAEARRKIDAKEPDTWDPTMDPLKCLISGMHALIGCKI